MRYGILSSETLFLLFLVVVLLVVFFNVILYVIYKTKRDALMKVIENRPHKKIENVELIVESKDDGFVFFYSLYCINADVILFENNLIVIPYRRKLQGLIKQFEPILQYCNGELVAFKDVSKLILDEDINFVNDEKNKGLLSLIRISTSKNKLELDFYNKSIDLEKLLVENKLIN